MKIINNTHWRTDHLRAFILRVALDELNSDQRQRVTVTIGYNRAVHRGYVTGWANYAGTVCRINVPSQVVDRLDLALVIAHEFAHNRGLHHRDMNSARYRRIGDWRTRYAWAASLPLDRKARTEKPSTDTLIAQRHAHAAKKLAEWERRIKLDQTHLKKWRAKVRYYERKAAAQKPPTPGEGETL